MASDDVYNTSELSLVIDKADSIEEKDEKSESDSRESVHGSIRQMKTFSCDDTVIEEEVQEDVNLIETREKDRKASVVTIEKKKSFDGEELKQSRPIEATLLPPTTTSTQTVPTAEFPEVAVTHKPINQVDDVMEVAQSYVETQQETKIAQEINMKANESSKMCSRSINENDGSSDEEAFGDGTTKSCSIASKSNDEQHQKQNLLAQELSMSQEEDYEVAMVSGLLPGCVAPAPTPAPSIGEFECLPHF